MMTDVKHDAVKELRRMRLLEWSVPLVLFLVVAIIDVSAGFGMGYILARMFG